MAILMIEMFLVGFKWPSLWINYIPQSSTGLSEMGTTIAEDSAQKQWQPD